MLHEKRESHHGDRLHSRCDRTHYHLQKGNETLTAAPADAGDYTASITLGEGENA